MSDIWIQLGVGIISAVVGAMLPLLIRWVRRDEPSPPIRQTAVAKSRAGGVAIATTGSVNGDINVDVDNSRRIAIKNVHNSYHQPQGAGKPGASNDEMWGFGLLAFLGIGLFATQFNVVLWFAIGAVIGLLATAVLGAQRAWRLYLWDRQKDPVIVAEVVLAVGATMWAWLAVLTSTHNGATFESLRLRSQTEAALMPLEPSGIAHWVGVVLNPIVAFYKIAVVEDQFFFIGTLTVAVVISFVLLALAWLRLNDWYSYMGFLFIDAPEGNERAGKRATRYIQRTGSDVWVFVVMAGFAVFCASGLLLQLMETTFANAESPIG